MKRCSEVCQYGKVIQCANARFDLEHEVKPGECPVAYPIVYRAVGPVQFKTTGRHLLGVKIEIPGTAV